MLKSSFAAAAAAATLFTAGQARGDLSITITPITDRSVNLKIDASGAVGDGSRAFIALLSPTSEVFIREIHEGVIGAAMPGDLHPDLTLNDARNGYATYDNLDNYPCLVSFGFASAPAAGSDLSDLSGNYIAERWIYSDFIPGTYELTNLDHPEVMRVPGTIQLKVVPEPPSLICGLISSIVGCGVWAKRRIVA